MAFNTFLTFILAVGYGLAMADSYRLIWSDEFNGAQGNSPDPSKWKYDLGNGDWGWGSNEKEYYTSDPSNVALDGEGHLVITARKITPDPSKQCVNGLCQYTSARIHTGGHFDFTYGKVDFRIQMPQGGQGIWPAAWMLGSNLATVGWPNCGEMDVIEWRGSQPSIVTSALHGPGYSGGGALGAKYDTQISLPNDYHIYTVEWEPDKITFLIDGHAYVTRTPNDLPAGTSWVYNGHPFFIIINLAVGGLFGGDPTDATPFPQMMKVDYVKVFQKI